MTERREWRLSARQISCLSRAKDMSLLGGTHTPESRPGDERKESVLTRFLRGALDSILCGRHADLGLEELRRGGALHVLSGVPELVGFGGGTQGHKDLWEHTKKVVIQSEPRVVIRWSALYHDVGKVRSFSDRDGKITFHGHEVRSANAFARFCDVSGLFPDAGERARVHGVVMNLGRVEAFEGEWTDSAVRRLDRELGDLVDDVICLSRADITTGRDSKRQAILRSIDNLVSRLARTRAEDAAPRLPKGLGDAIHERLGIPKDKRLGDLMASLKRDLDGGTMPADAGLDIWVARAGEILRSRSHEG